MYNTDGGPIHQRVGGKVYPIVYKDISRDSIEKFLGEEVLAMASRAVVLADDDSIYDIFDAQLCWKGGARKILSEGKPYTPQKTGSCTYKSLQVWLHEELQEMNNVYRGFKKYRLNKTVEKCASLYSTPRLAVRPLNEVESFIEAGREKLNKEKSSNNAVIPGYPNSPFLSAVEEGDLDFAKMLLRDWNLLANKNIFDDFVNLATEKVHLEIIKHVIEHYNLQGVHLEQIFESAVRKGQVAVVRFFLEEKLKEISPSSLKYALSLAVLCKQRFLVDRLLVIGKFSFEDVSGFLSVAVKSGCVSIVHRLVWELDNSSPLKKIRDQYFNQILLESVLAEFPDSFMVSFLLSCTNLSQEDKEALLAIVKTISENPPNLADQNDALRQRGLSILSISKDFPSLPDLLEGAIKSDNIRVVGSLSSLLKLEQSDFDFGEFLIQAVTSDRLAIARLLVENYVISEGFRRTAAKKAFEKGYIRALHFLDPQRKVSKELFKGLLITLSSESLKILSSIFDSVLKDSGLYSWFSYINYMAHRTLRQDMQLAENSGLDLGF